jgi:hypothetical protein
MATPFKMLKFSLEHQNLKPNFGIGSKTKYASSQEKPSKTNGCPIFNHSKG